LALNSTSGNVGIASDGGSDNLTGGSFSNRWGINHYNGKYVLTSAKSISSALRCTAAYPGAYILTATYSADNSAFYWTLDRSSVSIAQPSVSLCSCKQLPSGVFAAGPSHKDWIYIEVRGYPRGSTVETSTMLAIMDAIAPLGSVLYNGNALNWRMPAASDHFFAHGMLLSK
jgi:hypothetical protein